MKRSIPTLLSVVMPAFNGEQTIEDQLEALAAQSYEGGWELVVADNGSTDCTEEVARRWVDRIPNLRVISATDGRGVGYASNAGAREALGDFIAFCHQDDTADQHWLAAMASAASGAHAVGGVIDYSKLNDEIVKTWRPPRASDRLPVAMRFLPYAVGANLGMWRDVFEDIGGWSEQRTYGGEDIDLCWRLQLKGYRFEFAPGAVMHFRFRADLGSLWKQFVHFGRVEPHLFRAYRPHGVPRSSVKSAIKQWLWGLIHLGDLLRGPERKGVWIRKIAYRWGRLKGTFESRTIYL